MYGSDAGVHCVNRTRGLLWFAPTAYPVRYSPVLDGHGAAFLGDTSGNITAWNVATGALLWSTPLTSSPSAAPLSDTQQNFVYVPTTGPQGAIVQLDGTDGAQKQVWPAGMTVSSLAMNAGVLYFTLGLNVTAFDTGTWAVVWTRQLVATGAVSAPAIITNDPVNGVVLAVSASSGTTGSVFKLNSATGVNIKQANNNNNGMAGLMASVPAVDAVGNMLVVSNAELWTWNTTLKGAAALGTLSTATAPVVAGDNLILVASTNGDVCAAWRQISSPSPTSPPTATPTRSYTGTSTPGAQPFGSVPEAAAYSLIGVSAVIVMGGVYALVLLKGSLFTKCLKGRRGGAGSGAHAPLLVPRRT